MAAHVAAWLSDHGAEVQLDPVFPGRPNVIARLRAGGARRLLWEGHLDTVQATGMSVSPSARCCATAAFMGAARWTTRAA